LIADPTPKDLAGDNLFKSLHQALLMDRHLKRLQSIDVNFISDWVRSNIDQTHDDLFRDYVRHVLDISMMKKDLIIAAGNELDDLKDQLNSLKFQFKAELKTFFDLQNNFTSLLDIWRETHEKFEGAI
jgi:hypothetical protein